MSIFKYFNGRRYGVSFISFRVSLSMILVIACIPVEIAQTINQLFTSKEVYSTGNSYSPNFYLNLVQGVFIYTLFY